MISFGDAAIAQSVVRNIGSVEVTSSILVSSSEKVKRKAFRGMKLRKAFLFTAFLKMDFRGLVVRYVAVYHK